MFMGGKHIAAYNNELGIKASFTGVPGTFAVEGKTLLGLLKTSQADDVDFVLGNGLELRAGKTRVTLPSFKESEFLFEAPEVGKSLTINVTEDFLKGLKLALTTASRDNSMPALMGVTVDTTAGVRLYSCDGDALTRYVTDASAGGDGTYMLPNAFCEAMLKMEGTCDLDICVDWAIASFKDAVIYGRMIENDNPLNHETLIKDTMQDKGKFVTVPMGLSEALARARVLSDIESSETILTVKGSKLKLATDTRMGSINDEVSIRGHEAVQANIHASLVSRALQTFDEISIRENCTALKNGECLQIVSNVER